MQMSEFTQHKEYQSKFNSISDALQRKEECEGKCLRCCRHLASGKRVTSSKQHAGPKSLPNLITRLEENISLISLTKSGPHVCNCDQCDNISNQLKFI